MPNPFAPSTRFHASTLGLHMYAHDVTQLPATWVVGQALSLEHALYTNPQSVAWHLRQHFSPEAIEACMAHIFGQQGHGEVVVSLMNAHKVDENGALRLLVELADRTMVDLPNTANPQDAANMLYTLWKGDTYTINRFVSQAQKRLAIARKHH